MSKYKIPTDIPRVAVRWDEVSLAERVQAWNSSETDKTDWMVAVTISMVEQPGRIPNGNAVGLMPFSSVFPYGWKGDIWVVKPIGYVLLREGLTGNIAPFLAFSHWTDSIRVCAEIVKRRCIRTGNGYARGWVGAKTPGAIRRSADAFQFAWQKVMEAGGVQ